MGVPMLEANQPAAYYAGARDAAALWAWWSNGVERVGSGSKTLRDAMQKINALADASTGLFPEIEALNRKDAEIRQLKQWVDDLQSGKYINCVYCGHRYGPGNDPEANRAELLHRHIVECKKHPLAQSLALTTAAVLHLAKVLGYYAAWEDVIAPDEAESEAVANARSFLDRLDAERKSHGNDSTETR